MHKLQTITQPFHTTPSYPHGQTQESRKEASKNEVGRPGYIIHQTGNLKQQIISDVGPYRDMRDECSGGGFVLMKASANGSGWSSVDMAEHWVGWIASKIG